MTNLNIGKEEIPSGTVIDNRYQIETILGQGGLGRTYLAFDIHRFNEPCVLKEFAPLGSGEYGLEKSRDLFKREAKILHCITHPQIPKFLACFEAHERLFLVQEFVNGQTYSALLKERQKQGRAFSEPEVIRWLIDVLPILDYIHQRGIIHRDISPDNIMQPEGEELPVLIDFGVGKLTNTASQSGQFGLGSHSYVGKMSFVGKIGYAPIEQISMGKCSPSSDLYSLGVTALVLLTGKDPTLLLNQDSLEWQWQQYVQVSPGFAQFMSKMTEARPLKRYQSAQETLKDLERYFADLDTIIQRSNQEKVTTLKSQPQLGSSERKIPLATPPSNHPTRLQTQIQKQGTVFQDSTKITNNQKQNDLSFKDSQQDRPESIVQDDHEEDTIIVGFDKANSTSLKKAQQLSNERQSNNSSFEDTMIVTPSQEDLSTSNSSELNPEFIKFCHQELAYFIGPIASLIVEETLENSKLYSSESFVEALAQQIPNMELRIKFKRRLL